MLETPYEWNSRVWWCIDRTRSWKMATIIMQRIWNDCAFLWRGIGFLASNWFFLGGFWNDQLNHFGWYSQACAWKDGKRWVLKMFRFSLIACLTGCRTLNSSATSTSVGFGLDFSPYGGNLIGPLTCHRQNLAIPGYTVKFWLGWLLNHELKMYNVYSGTIIRLCLKSVDSPWSR